MFFPLRDENPTRTFPFITVLLIVVTTLMFFLEVTMGRYRGNFVASYGVIPYEIANAIDINPRIPFTPYLTLITSLFLHGSFLHLLGNMWFLWIFGNNVEDAMGHFKFLVFYLVGGVAASLLQILATSSSTAPIIGASGAVSAILGAYMIKYPRARVKTLIFIIIFVTVINVPAIAFIGIWFILQLFYAAIGAMSNVAWYAHIGGFIFGVIVVILFKKRGGYKKYSVY